MIIKLKDTDIEVKVNNSDELHSMYHCLGYKYVFVMPDGTELKKHGVTEKKGNVISTFAGYTPGYFRKYYFPEEISEK